MPTIKDIARAVGVSHATVSNVLNHKGNVSAQKVKLVMDAAKAMGYRVNEAASSLRSGGALCSGRHSAGCGQHGLRRSVSLALSGRRPKTVTASSSG